MHNSFIVESVIENNFMRVCKQNVQLLLSGRDQVTFFSKTLNDLLGFIYFDTDREVLSRFISKNYAPLPFSCTKKMSAVGKEGTVLLREG